MLFPHSGPEEDVAAVDEPADDDATDEATDEAGIDEEIWEESANPPLNSIPWPRNKSEMNLSSRLDCTWKTNNPTIRAMAEPVTTMPVLVEWVFAKSNYCTIFAV